MSLSKELCLRSNSQNSHSFSDCFLNTFESKEDNYRRDSFDDRFCDDLCEDILQYLSLEDKLRLECVSKQFRRTVFQRQYELYVNFKDQKIYLSNRFRYDYDYIEVQNMDSFKALLKKCPNITSIELNGDHHKVNEMFRLIIENCDDLSEINNFVGPSYRINDNNLQEFYRKFGPKIKSLRTYTEVTDFNRFPNIKKLKITHLNDSIIATLKQLEITIDPGQERLLQTVIDNFPTLTHFNVSISSEDENAIYESLKNISNLKHLIHFQFVYLLENNKQFCDLFKKMANNCLNLKSIVCRFNVNQNSDIRQFFSQLKAFPALKRLNLRFFFINNEGTFNSIDVNQLFSFELFKGFSNITHLTLCFGLRHTLKKSILKDIDINLPKIQCLNILDIFDTNPEEVKLVADILSSFSRLESIKLKFRPAVDFKPIEGQITKKCRKIREIEIKNSRFNEF